MSLVTVAMIICGIMIIVCGILFAVEDEKEISRYRRRNPYQPRYRERSFSMHYLVFSIIFALVFSILSKA